MDYWKTQYLAKHGGQASASRVIIASQDEGCAPSRVECTAGSEAASVCCTLGGQSQIGDDMSVLDEKSVVSLPQSHAHTLLISQVTSVYISTCIESISLSW